MKNIDHYFLFLLGRHATESEITQLADLSDDRIRTHIMHLPEFDSDRYGNEACALLRSQETTQEDVVLGYAIVLGREPESAEVIQSKVANLPRLVNLRADLIQSLEFQILYERSFTSLMTDSLIHDAYLLFLQRPAALTADITRLHGASLQAVCRSFTRSPEFVAKHGLVRSDLLNNKSVLILGYPKGVSSAFYQMMCEALTNALNPSPASDGEILNVERYLYAQIHSNQFNFWTTPDASGYAASKEAIFSLLDAHCRGFIVKDVCYPFQVLDYLSHAENRDKFNVFVIRRDTREVLAECKRVGWHFVTEEKLSLIDATYATHFDHIMASDFVDGRADAAMDWMCRHYRDVSQVNYLSEDFLQKRAMSRGRDCAATE